MVQVQGFIAWAIGVLSGFAVFVALTLFFPILALVPASIVSVVVFFVVSGVFYRVFSRKALEDAAKSQSEYRVSMETEKQKQIDEMLRSNSRIPKVERSEP